MMNAHQEERFAILCAEVAVASEAMNTIHALYPDAGSKIERAKARAFREPLLVPLRQACIAAHFAKIAILKGR